MGHHEFEHEDDILVDSEQAVAEIIVGDTIHTAHTRPDMLGNGTVEDCLDALTGNESDQVMNSLLAEYCGSTIAARSTGQAPSFDRRVAKLGQISINANRLRQKIAEQLTGYLDMEPDQQADIRRRLASSRSPEN